MTFVSSDPFDCLWLEDDYRPFEIPFFESLSEHGDFDMEISTPTDIPDTH
jgi:hypothetical protein